MRDLPRRVSAAPFPSFQRASQEAAAQSRSPRWRLHPLADEPPATVPVHEAGPELFSQRTLRPHVRARANPRLPASCLCPRHSIRLSLLLTERRFCARRSSRRSRPWNSPAASETWSCTVLLGSAALSCCGRFGPLRNRPPVVWCHLLESWRQDGENSENMTEKRAKMGETWSIKKSARCPSMLAQQVSPFGDPQHGNQHQQARADRIDPRLPTGATTITDHVVRQGWRRGVRRAAAGRIPCGPSVLPGRRRRAGRVPRDAALGGCELNCLGILGVPWVMSLEL